VTVDQGTATSGSRRRRGDLIAATLLCGYAFLTLAWLMSNAPFAAPDEAHHFVRAIGVGHGTLLGSPAPTFDPSADPVKAKWLNQANRSIEVPAGMSPSPYACEDPFRADISAACMRHARPSSVVHPETTPVGTYQPLTYFLPGATMRLSHRSSVALRIGRASSAVTFLGLFGWGVILLARSRRGLGWVPGLLLGITPMVVFTGSSLQPSGPELAAAILLLVGLLRLIEHEQPGRAPWVAVAAGGSVLAMSKSLSPLWVFLIFVVFALWFGPVRLVALVRKHKFQAIATTGVLLVALLANRGWEALYGPTVPYNVPTRSELTHALGQFGWIYRQEIGIFGYLETSMSTIAYELWTIALAAVIGLAVLVGDRRERRGLLTALTVNAFVPAALTAVVLYKTGFDAQGRHVLPFAVTLPILAGYTLAREKDRFGRLRPRHLATTVAVIVAGVHLAGLYANARRHAVGVKGPIMFLGHSQWSPPGGWLPWGLVAGLGAGLLVIGAALADRVESLSEIETEVEHVPVPARDNHIELRFTGRAVETVPPALG
jgi:hypothetical protein